MVSKWYEVTCDYCGRGINHYPERRPTRHEMESDGIVCTSLHQFCSQICWGEWNHDRQQQQYCNIHPDGRMHLQ